ncbi:hypothetical protein KAW08_04355 [bacterium]|nr:hypothetical protein [bacterium]
MGFGELKISEIDKSERKKLGVDIPVTLFRLIRLIGMGKLLGDSSGAALYTVGKTVGETLGVKTAEELLKLVEDLKIGIPKVVEMSDKRIIVDVFECVTCSGIPNIGEVVCHFEAGLIAGALGKILGKGTKTTETKCWGKGDKVCEFETLLF